jgi:hypothetical protein
MLVDLGKKPDVPYYNFSYVIGWMWIPNCRLLWWLCQLVRLSLCLRSGDIWVWSTVETLTDTEKLSKQGETALGFHKTYAACKCLQIGNKCWQHKKHMLNHYCMNCYWEILWKENLLNIMNWWEGTSCNAMWLGGLASTELTQDIICRYNFVTMAMNNKITYMFISGIANDLLNSITYFYAIIHQWCA